MAVTNPNTVFFVARNIIDNANKTISTAESFKSWDTCKENKVCKGTAIALIIIAAIIVFFIICAIVNCFCCAISCIDNLCCCCKGRSSRGARQQGFAPLPEPQYSRQVEPVYVPPQSYQPNAYYPNAGPYQNTAYQPSTEMDRLDRQDPYAYELKQDSRYQQKY